MRLIHETDTTATLEHDGMIFLHKKWQTPPKLPTDVMAYYVDQCSTFQPVMRKSVYGRIITTFMRAL